MAQNSMMLGYLSVAIASQLITLLLFSPWLRALLLAVRLAPLSEIIAKHSAHCIVDIPCDDPAAVIAAARSQVGKPYDLTALFGLLVRRDWQEADAWFCSELTAWAFQQGGSPLFRPEALYRITPQHLWMIAK